MDASKKCRDRYVETWADGRGAGYFKDRASGVEYGIQPVFPDNTTWPRYVPPNILVSMVVEALNFHDAHKDSGGGI